MNEAREALGVLLIVFGGLFVVLVVVAWLLDLAVGPWSDSQSNKVKPNGVPNIPIPPEVPVVRSEKPDETLETLKRIEKHLETIAQAVDLTQPAAIRTYPIQ